MRYDKPFSTTFRAVAGFVALFFIVISLTSKVPSSKCHCHDPLKSKKEICPYGTLRTLTFIAPTVAPVIVSITLGYLAVTFFAVVSLRSIVSSDSYYARAPPKSVKP